MIRGVTLIELLRREYAPRKLHLSQGSLDNYRRAVNSLQRHWEREISVAELNEELILPWLKQRLKQAAPKTGMPQVLALHDEVIVALAGVHHRERELVWPYPYNRRQIWPQLKRILKAASHGGVSCHISTPPLCKSR